MRRIDVKTGRFVAAGRHSAFLALPGVSKFGNVGYNPEIFHQQAADCMPYSRLFFALLTLIGAGMGAPLRGDPALDPSKEVRQYAHRVWTMKDGMTQGAVRAIAQTTDGYLWVGTSEGLARFDGTSFTLFTPTSVPQLKEVVITALQASQDGTLWIATLGGLTLFRDGRFENSGLFAALDSTPIRAFARGKDGGIWAATGAGLIGLGAEGISGQYTAREGMPGKGALAALQMGDGSILAGTAKGVYILRNGRATPHPNEILQRAIVTGFARDDGGNIWMITPDAGVLCLRPDGKVVALTEKDGLPTNRLTTVCCDNSGAVWFGGYGGNIARLYGGQISSLRTREGFSSEIIHSLFSDREGNLWAGTSTACLHRYVDGAFVTIPSGVTDAEQMVWCVANDPTLGPVIGTEAGDLLRWDGKRFVPHPVIRKRLEGAPLAYLRDRKGKLWVGTTGGLTTFDHGKSEHFPTGSVLALREDREGSVWVGTSKGLFEFCETGPRPISGLKGMPPVGIRAVVESRMGGYWIATNGGGLIRLKTDSSGTVSGCGSGYTAYTTGEGLGSNWVVSILEDAEGIVWATTPGAGLNVVRDGKVRRLGLDDGLPDQSFLNLAEDDSGYLWCSSNRGIYRIRKADLVARLDGGKARVPWTPFGIDDGMASSECNGGFQSAILRTRDGQLWFPTTAGVAVVHPGNLHMSDEPPPIVLQEMSIEREDVDPRGGASVVHRKGELEFHYAGLFLSAPERVRYRFRLEGFDQEWVEAGVRRTAYYTNIPPGVYTFRVMASVSEGYWSGIPVSASVTLSPRFFQTGWFLGLCVLVGASIFAGGFALYRRDREREVRSSRLQSELARTQLQVLEMQLQPHFLFNTLNSIMVLIGKDPGMAEKTIGRLADILRRSLDRGAAQEVTLGEEMDFLERYLDIERVRFGDRLTVERRMAPGVADALVPTMLLQPLVENAIRHGVSVRRGPARIEIGATRENGTLMLHIRDNGVGLKGTDVVKMGIGLSNTRERLRQLYGDSQQLRLESIPEGGVDVQVILPYHRLSMGPWNESGR